MFSAGASSLRAPSTIARITAFGVLLTFFNSVTGVCTTNELRFALVVHRHGDRYPIVCYKEDPHQIHDWHGRLGTLTPAGSKQMCDMGLKLRKRYGSLLEIKGKFASKNVRIVSSSVKRCIASAEYLLTCMTSETKNNGLMVFKNYPVNFTIIPEETDFTLRQSRPCPKYSEMRSKMLLSPVEDSALRRFNKKNARLYAYVSKHTGENITNVKDMADIYDTLLVERNNNLSLPKWTRSVFPVKLRKFAERFMLLRTENDFMARIRGGATVTAIFEQLLLATKGRVHGVELFSAHDMTLVNVMKTLGTISQVPILPSYGAALAFELHYNCGDWIVKIFYFADAHDRKPKMLHMPKCGNPCKLVDFRKSLHDIWLTEDQYTAACQS